MIWMSIAAMIAAFFVGFLAGNSARKKGAVLVRSLRVKDEILLPNGERLRVDLDVESCLPALIAGENNVIKAAFTWNKTPQDSGAREAFYAEYGKYLATILGRDALAQAVTAYDGHLDEFCEQVDAWVHEAVHVKLAAASQRKMERMRKEIQRQGRAAKHE